MRLYDTLSEQKVELAPADGVVRMYVCGITPYDTTHLGHARTYIVFDVLWRYVETRGYQMLYVQNVTDIDDDILRKARQVDVSWDVLGRRETERYLRDMQSLHVRYPSHYIRATDEIPFMQEIAAVLLEKGLAYERNGSVYYDVSQDPEFGAISHLGYAEMLEIANQRGNYPDDPNKDDPLDFVVWQASQPGEPSWESPWGPGRPGWHIECSAMSVKYLGPQLDVHGSGSDLQFPHHAAEIAQCEAFTGVKPFVKSWMHVGMVYLDGEKMSKSLGNLILVSNLLQQYSPDTIRLALLRHHYREAFEYYESEMVEAAEIAARWRQVAQLAQGGTPDEALARRVTAAFEDDFDVPAAIQIVDALATDVLEQRAEPAGAAELVRQVSAILGLTLQDAS